MSKQIPAAVSASRRVHALIFDSQPQDAPRRLEGAASRASGASIGAALLHARPGAAVAQRPLVDALTDHVVAHELMAALTEPGSGAPDAGEASTLAASFELCRSWIDQAKRAGLALDDRLLLLPIGPALVAGAPEELAARLDALGACGPTANRVVVQMDEGRLLGDSGRKRAVIALFRARGYRIAISGFGAGYESLKDLIHAPPDYLRLSPVLTRRLERDRGRRGIVAALVSLAADLGMELIADQVDDPAHADTLLDLGIRLQLGALHGVPTPIGSA